MRTGPPRVDLAALAFPALIGAAAGVVLWAATCGMDGTRLHAAALIGAAAGAIGAYADRWRNPREVR